MLLPKAHQIEREYIMITALFDAGYPVPKPYLLCEDDDIIGTPFYVMQYVRGRIFRDPELKEIPAAQRASYYYALVDVLK